MPGLLTSSCLQRLWLEVSTSLTMTLSQWTNWDPRNVEWWQEPGAKHWNHCIHATTATKHHSVQTLVPAQACCSVFQPQAISSKIGWKHLWLNATYLLCAIVKLSSDQTYARITYFPCWFWSLRLAMFSWGRCQELHLPQSHLSQVLCLHRN